ncbi:MAG: outer membrane beta-barrel protein [Candidatus Omnitrophota bacterium]
MSFLYGKKVKTYLCYMLAVFLVIGFAGSAFAQRKPNLHIGTLEFHPFAYYDQLYDTNIFLEPRGHENDDFISDIGLGMAAKMPLIAEREEDFMIEGSYKMDILAFWRNSQINRVDHTATGLLDLNFANDFRYTATEYFNKTADPPNSERTSLDKRLRNVLSQTLGYTREKITLEAGYELTTDKYMQISNLNHNEHKFTAASFYQIFPKTSLFGEYNFARTVYHNNITNSDSIFNQGFFGIEGIIAPKLTGIAKAGFRFVDYDDKDASDWAGFALFVNVKYDATERTELNLYADRTSEESTYQGNSYYEKNKIGLNVNHELMERLWIDGDTFLQYNVYPTESLEGNQITKRRDTLWGLGSGLKYEIKEWLFVNGGYEFKQRDSKFDDLDYNDHKVSARLTLTY